jgi:hypothetical protein
MGIYNLDALMLAFLKILYLILQNVNSDFQ